MKVRFWFDFQSIIPWDSQIQTYGFQRVLSHEGTYTKLQYHTFWQAETSFKNRLAKQSLKPGTLICNTYIFHKMVTILYQRQYVNLDNARGALHHDYVIKWKHFHVTGRLCWEFPSQRPVTQSFDVFFDLRLNKRLSKQSKRRWLETTSRSL